MDYEAKLKTAKDMLEKKYIMHPDYRRKDNPAHSYPESWFMRKVKEESLKNKLNRSCHVNGTDIK
jgi:hypothetical protein